jgi:hypothetical protein
MRKENSLKPAYGIETCKSKVEPVAFESFDVVMKNIDNGYAVLWQYHDVFVGKIGTNTITWANDKTPESDFKKHLVRLRVFNNEMEYHFWRTGNKIKGRLRIDTEGDDVSYVDTSMNLRGVAGEQVQKLHDNNHSYFIKTRNYLNAGIEQAGYVDSRFVEFVTLKIEIVMEEAIITRHGKGWSITLDSGKKLTCNWKNLPDELDGKQITIVRKDGAPYKITFEEREFMQPTQNLQPQF